MLFSIVGSATTVRVEARLKLKKEGGGEGREM